MKQCSNCSNVLPKSKKPNKTGLCSVCYKKHNYQKWIKNNDRSEYRRQYALDNRERLTANKNTKYSNDPLFKLKEILKTRLSKAITRGQKDGSAVKDLGCSVEELKIHLESKFQPGMTWENYGEWHIDHVVPLAKFDLLNREELLKACNYTNLQPLWAIDNIKKRDK